MARKRRRSGSTRRRSGPVTAKSSSKISYTERVARAQSLRIRRAQVTLTRLGHKPPGESKTLATRPREAVAVGRKVGFTAHGARRLIESARERPLYKRPVFPPRVTPIKTALHLRQAYKLAAVGAANPCKERQARREVIFATKRQGRGNHGSYRRTATSRIGCK